MLHTTSRFDRRGAGLGGIVLSLVVIAVCILLIGFWRGWFAVSTAEHVADDRRDVTFSIDQQKVRQDTEGLAERAEALGERVESVAEVDSLTATVTKVDLATRQLTVTTGNDESQQFDLQESTTIEINDQPSSLNALAAGDKVVVIYRETDGQREVQKVTRLDNEADR